MNKYLITLLIVSWTYPCNLTASKPKQTQTSPFEYLIATHKLNRERTLAALREKNTKPEELTDEIRIGEMKPSVFIITLKNGKTIYLSETLNDEIKKEWEEGEASLKAAEEAQAAQKQKSTLGQKVLDTCQIM